MNTLIVLKIFGSRNGRREYKPKEQKKFLSVLDAQHYIEENNLCLYDLLVDNKVIDRNGNGSPEKFPKKEKKQEIRYITVTNESKVLDFLQSKTGITFKNAYPFKKGDNNFAVTLSGKHDANAVWRYLNNSAAFTILQIDANNFAISFAVITSDFNETIKWQPKELPQTSTTSLCKTVTEFANSFTFQQMLEILS